MCLDWRLLISMPYSRITAIAFGCTGLGRLPALAAVTAGPASCSAIAWAICDRALFPVHKNSSRACARGRPGAGGRSRSPGCRAAPVAASSSPQRARSML
jgi:hypothetical protein